MAALPSLAGALQDRTMVTLPRAAAVRSFGAPGGSSVMAEAVLEGAEVPSSLMAETR